MLSLFRTNQILGSVYFLIYLFLLRGSVFLFPDQQTWEPTQMGVLSALLWKYLPLVPSWAPYALAYLLIFIQAISISYIIRKHRILSEDILLPGASYLLVASSIPEFLYLSPLLIATTFLIIALDQLMATYRVPSCDANLFNVGFWVGVASLFYFSSLVYLLVAIVGLGTLRAWKFREIIVLWSGALVVYILATTCWFWMDQLPYFWEYHVLSNVSFLNIEETLNFKTLVSLSIIAFMLIAVLIASFSLFRTKTILYQKKVGILYFLLFVSAFSFVFQSNIDINHVYILVLPIGVLLGLMMKDMRSSTSEVFNMFLLLIILIWQLHPFWIK